MRTHIETKHKAGLIQKAHNLRNHGYNLKSIGKNLDLDPKYLEKWLREYDHYLEGIPCEYKFIKRCLPYFKKKQTITRIPKIELLWGMIKIY
jgi:hypothetical protein